LNKKIFQIQHGIIYDDEGIRMDILVYQVAAFTQDTQGGNPAGVVLNPPFLSEDQMMRISRDLRVSETAYISPEPLEDFKIRYFSPTVEVDLCGHATIASFFLMGSFLYLPSTTQIRFQMRTKAGVLPVSLLFSEGMIQRVMMQQQHLKLRNVSVSRKMLAETVGVPESMIESDYSSHAVSTGLFTLPICVKGFDTLANIQPNAAVISDLCRKINVGSLHVFTFETNMEDSLYHARNFAPLYGVLEDPVTGTANGAVSSFLFHKNVIQKKQCVCEQGDIIGRSGRVFVDLSDENVWVGGSAVLIQKTAMSV